jgi:hypothetical protein
MKLIGHRAIRRAIVPLLAGVMGACALRSSPPERVADASLEQWILERPRIAAAIRWEEVDGFRSYTAWTPAERAELSEYFGYAQTGMFPIAPLPDNLWAGFLEDSESPSTVLSRSDARALYLAHLAQALWTEISGAVAWSIQEYPSAQLSTLLGAESFFSLDRPQFPSANVGTRPSGYHLVHRGLPAPPHVVLAFLTEHDLIGATPRITIGNVLGWSRGMVHFWGRSTTGNYEDHWHYRGVPPLVRVLEGTVHSEHEYVGLQHWTAGCHGTTIVLRDILRIVNIPVEYRTAAGHATPYFPTEQAYLSHGDDPYNALLKGRFPPLPGNEELLIDVATWESWFGEAVPEVERRNGIGRRTRELSLAYLTERILSARCTDVSTGVSREGGSLFTIYSRDYTLAELDSLDLWARVDRRISELGGCDEIVQARPAPAPAGTGRLTAYLLETASESGSVRSDGVVANVWNGVGDMPDGTSAQLFLSFDVSRIPTGSTITEATIDVRHEYDLLGNPFDLGCLLLYSHEYGTLESGDFVTGTPAGELGRWCSSREPPTVRWHGDSTELIRAALQSSVGAARVRFRMQFEKATNGDAAADMMRLMPQVRLIVTYTLPPVESS